MNRIFTLSITQKFLKKQAEIPKILEPSLSGGGEGGTVQ